MKTLFFLLLSANLVFILLGQFGSGPEQRPGPSSPRPELYPERIILLPAPVNCVEWGNFLGKELELAKTSIDGLALGDAVSQRVTGKVPVYWVHIPPRNTREEAERKTAELRKLGVEAYSLVETDDQWNNAISMGMLRNPDAARRLLIELKMKGVRSVTIGERNLSQIAFIIRNPTAATMERLEKFKTLFQESKLTTLKCKTSVPSG
jgi:hypothetical protein